MDVDPSLSHFNSLSPGIVSGGHGFRRAAFNNTDTLGVLVS
jgi:hypothetical protein